MNFSAWAIRQPTPSILLFFMLMVAGLIAFQRLGIQSMPDMEFPSVSLVASVPGAAPEQLEAEVARPIEDAVSSIGSVRHVSTTINDGAVSLMIEFTYEKDTQEAVIDVRDAVARIRSTLPAEMQEPVVSRVEIAGLPIVTYAVSSDRMDEADLSWFVDDTVSRALLQARGVAEVRRQGGVTREVRVELNPIRLQAQRVTPGEISSQLRRMQQEAPGGRGDLSGLEQTVRTLGTVADAAALAQMSLPLADGRRLRLGDVAEVRNAGGSRCWTAHRSLGSTSCVRAGTTTSPHQKAFTPPSTRSSASTRMSVSSRSRTPSTSAVPSTRRRCVRSTRAASSRFWWSGPSCGTGVRRWWRRWRCRCRSSRPSSSSWRRVTTSMC
jgi:multidrug efflux pump subunit AcrB